jgi:hypothetical protein
MVRPVSIPEAIVVPEHTQDSPPKGEKKNAPPALPNPSKPKVKRPDAPPQDKPPVAPPKAQGPITVPQPQAPLKPKPATVREDPPAVPCPKAPSKLLADSEPEWAIPLDAEPVGQENAGVKHDAAPAKVGAAPVAEHGESKKKKKPKRVRERSDQANRRTWVWWVAAASILLVGLAGAVVWAIRNGHTDEVIGHTFTVAITLPVSLVILVVSMVVASHVAGGIDFGEARTAIPKTLFLLLVINLMNVLLPWYIAMMPALAAFLFGFIVLFGLDLWEASFLSFVNGTLNQWIAIYILGQMMEVWSNAPGPGVPSVQ